MALGKDRQMDIRVRDRWPPGVDQALLRTCAPVALGMTETENKAMENEKKDPNDLPKENETYAHTKSYAIVSIGTYSD